MEKQAVIAPGITPLSEEAQEALIKEAVTAAHVGGKGRTDVRCSCSQYAQKRLPFKEAVAQLEDDAISRMAKIAAVK